MKQNPPRSVGRKLNGSITNEYLVDGKYSIKDLVDINRLRELFEEFSKTTGFTTGLVSFPDQEILIATGWRDACTQFHRPCPASVEACRQSNIYLTSCLRNLKELSVKTCSNGLTDGATPVIVRGKHLASVSTGQVLFEPPDLDYFRRQAKQYGYPEKPYLAAIQKIPVVTRKQLKQVMRHLSSLAVFVAEEGLNALRAGESAALLTEENERRRKSEQALQLSEEKYRILFEGSTDAILIRELSGRLLDCNETAIRLYQCPSKQDFISTYPHGFASKFQEDGRDSKEAAMAYLDEAGRDGRAFFHWLGKKHDGTVFPVEVLLSRLEMAGKPVFLSVVRDISERKRVASELRHERDRAQRYLDTVEAIIVALDIKGHITLINQKGYRLLGYKNEEELIGRPWFSTCLPQPEGMEKIFPFFQKLINEKTESVEYIDNSILTRSGEERIIAWHNSLLRDETGKITGTLSAGEDITEKKRAEEALVRANRALNALDECNSAILQARNEQELFDEICRIIVESGGYKTAWIGLVESGPRKLVRPAAQAGGRSEFLQKAGVTWADTPRGHGPAGTCIRTRKVTVCVLSKNNQIAAPMIREARKQGWVAGIGVPLMMESECIGSLVIYSGQPNDFDIEQQNRLEGFVKNLMAGITILRTRAEMENLQKGILNVGEQIQQKLGQELHDDLGQQLTGMALIAGVVEKKLRKSENPAAGEVRELLQMMTDATSTTRALAHGLYPVDLEPGGLLLTLEKLAARTSTLPGVHCRLKVRSFVQFTPVRAIHLFRIVQEAVNNAIKHGLSKKILIEYFKTKDSATLAVSSDGLAFTKTSSNGDGLGLKLMKYRAGLIGGKLDIREGEKGGCRVICTFPS
ncbi:MAG: PocR ligand-binding domain-containing protein [Verrucomicrobiota bacterium]